MHQAVKRRVGARRVRIPSGSDHRPVGAEKNSECTLCTIVTQLRMQAESVPNLMEPHADDYGYSAIFKHYPQITAATKLIQIPAGQRCLDILDPIDNGGWSALEYTDTVLSHHSNEAPISDDQYQEYLSRVRVLIDHVVTDSSLSHADRSQIVDLLHKVEQALLDIKINGTLAVQEAVAAAGAVVRLSPSLWERNKSRPWVRDFGAVLFAIFMALEGTANALAIEQYFSDEPQRVTVIDHQDRHEQATDHEERQDGQRRQDQPTDQPTPR